MRSFFIRLTVCVAAFAAAGAAPFDTPIDKKVIALPADPANPRAKPNRTCFTYPGFVVKQVDLGEKGAAELSITSFTNKAPPCAAKIAGETIIDWKDWSGYFAGAKGPFVFFDADDGLNGGMPFAVFRAQTGKKLFEDTSRLDEALKSVAVVDGALVMHYGRVWPAPCSLMSDGKACWKKIMAATGLADPARPDCTKAYQEEITRFPKYAKKIPTYKSVIAYNVEGRYVAGKLALKPEAGPVTCWLED
jgi:hypothetical protein